MDYISLAKYVRISPRKARAVTSAVKDLSVADALDQLEFLARSSSQPILKTLKSAIANSKKEAKDLKIKNILVDEGTRRKTWDKGHRFGRDRGVIQKRTSHIKIVLTDGQ